MSSYRKKPVVVQAHRWDGFEGNLPMWAYRAYKGDSEPHPSRGCIIIATLEGDMTCNIGDYLIQGVKGEVYPVREDIFEETYDEVKDE